MLMWHLGGYFAPKVGENCPVLREFAYASHAQFIFGQVPPFLVFFLFCVSFSPRLLLFCRFAVANFGNEGFSSDKSSLWPRWRPVAMTAIMSRTNVDARPSAEPHSRVLSMRR